ncbi:autotransporter-associated beta strand repeat-containing protein [Sphingomonas sp.]|uniref:autotransporter-associated beta strand repeat-containing protein n=1 Tax=Sphingomonas sp. TaxID=28214 RepID=UPI0025FED07A|nr:autotransporter-associated beta strand repeat-containing protein [Sphingomonas sp.]
MLAGCPKLHARTSIAAGILLTTFVPVGAWANCTMVSNNPPQWVCSPPTPQTTRIGSGPNTQSGATVTVDPGAQVNVGNQNAISLGDNATITVGDGATVTNNGTNSSNQSSLWGVGPNTIEFGSNGTLTIGTGAFVTANGSANNGEPINVMGTGNMIVNRGTVSSRSGAAIWFEDKTTGAGNTVDNYGVIETQLGANANVIGNQRTSDVTFINRTGATVRGSLSFAGGNDSLTLETGSVITGSFNGGGGTNSLSLSGTGNDSLAGDIRNFQTLNKDGTGTWTLTGAIGANGGNEALQVFVNAGTLALTGNNANFNGAVTVNPAGTLEARAQSLPPSVLDNGLVRFVQDTAGTYSGVISGSGAVEKNLGGELTLAGVNSYSGGTTINAGTVLISQDANIGAAAGTLTLNGGILGVTADVTTARATTVGPLGGGLSAVAGTTLTHNGAINGPGALTKSGAGTVILTGSNFYLNGTRIEEGVLQVSSNGNLGLASGPLTFSGGTLRTTATMELLRFTTIDSDGGTIETAGGTTATIPGSLVGAGRLTKSGDGTLLLTGTNSYLGGTLVTAGTVEIGSDAALGDPAGLLTLDGGTLRITQSATASRSTLMGPAGGTIEVVTGADVNYSGSISGAGSATKTGGGNLFLTGTSNYTGNTTIAAGALYVDGDLSAATGNATVLSGARLSGNGTYGGSVTVNGGGILAAGNVLGAPGILTMGNLTLSGASNLFLNVIDTTVGGALNDLIVVNGDLVLDGQVNVLDQGQNLGPGVYRIINYTGALTNNTLDIGGFAAVDGTPTRPLDGFSVQTAVPNQVNLINTNGLSLNYWDGADIANANNNVINGGPGTWLSGAGAPPTWTDPNGAVNAPWADGQFAIFVGTPATVTASNALGQITTSGMQFGVNGYVLTGDPLLLVDSAATPGVSTIRVGDGTSLGASYVATISAPLTGATQLLKTDAGRLILSGVNSYSGGTRIQGGTIQIASDANLGAVSTGLSLDSGTLATTADITTDRAVVIDPGNGTFDTSAGTTLTLSTALSGVGALQHRGAGNLTLLADSTHSGGTINFEGTLQLGNGGTGGAITGPMINQGVLLVNRSDQLVLADLILGGGSLVQAGTGTTVLTADDLYIGGTTISAGTLQLGAGGATGSVVGPIVDNAALTINHSNEFTLANVVSGTGTLTQSGSGTTLLTGANSYTGGTTVSAGQLYVDGDQTAATGAAVALSGTRLGGSGVIGGDVTIQDGAMLSPGANPTAAGTLTINGNLNLAPNSSLLYNMTSTTVGAAGNDLTNVGGNLLLDGTINLVDQGQQLAPGVYRVFNYSGALLNAGLTLGGYTVDGTTITAPLTGFLVQTSIPNQVNLINTAGQALNYWDGVAIGVPNDGAIQGGNGTWQVGALSPSSWTDPDGAANAPWANGSFAIFVGAPGTVVADNLLGQIQVAGMQFGVDGYTLTGGPIELVGSTATPGDSTIRVGDGSPNGAAMTATISAPLFGTSLLRKSDAGTLVLSGANTYTGGTVVDGGTLEVSADTNLGDAAGRLTLADGTLRAGADMTSARAVVLNGLFGGTFETATSGGAATTLQLDGAIGGTGGLFKTGAGTLLLTADNAYRGGTTISAGTLQLGNGGTTGGLLGLIEDNGALVVNRSNAFTIFGTISGIGSLEQAGTGTTILTADNTYTGGTTISAGTLQIGNGGTTGHVVGDIVDNSILVINRSDTKLTPGVISGTGQLIQAGTGITVLQADNSYTGGTTINAGMLQLGDGGTAGSIVGDVTNNSVLAFNRSDVVTFGGVISGPGSLLHLGTGTTILTGANTMTGGTTVAAGTLQIGDGGTNGQLFGDIVNNGTVILDRSDDILYSGSISGTGNTIKNGAGTLIVTGTGTYTGGTTINAGILQLGNGGTSGSIIGDVVDNAALVVNRSDSILLSGVVSGTGRFEQAGTGTTVFEGDNSYTGGTLISAGTLQVGNGGVTGSIVGDVTDNGRLVFNRADTFTFGGLVSGTGELVQAGLGTLILTNANSYTGGTAIESGTLQVAADNNMGDPAGPLRISGGTLHTTTSFATTRATTLAQQGGTFDVDPGTTLTHNGVVTGAGSLTKVGTGTLILTGTNDYGRETFVNAGTLQVNGDQTLATGPTSVASGATLAGIGIIGGDVSIADGGILAPGTSPGTLTIAGDLALSAGSILNYEFGQANVPGGPLNDLTIVGGDLVLDGTINVTVSAGGSFDPGVYRVFNYAGTLTDNGLSVGTIPATGYYVQTSIANQVNLVNTSGLTLNYWDGAAGPKNDGVVNGGDGLWQSSAGNDNWTIDAGTPNAPFTDSAFAIFTGAPGTVTVDPSLGPINAAGMQFATDGYLVQGDTINLVGAGTSIIRVGDGTAAGAAMTATIGSVLAGTTSLTKTDLGTLILTGANSYSGGTVIDDGVLQIASDTNLGAAAGTLSFDGGTLRTTADMTIARATDIGSGGGTIETLAGTTLTHGSAITGVGALTKTGDGTLISTADNGYTGGTTIAAGTLQLGNGGTAGSVVGDIVDNAALVVNRSNEVTLAGVISGTGTLTQAGTGTTILTGANSYAGTTTVAAGTLLVNGDQSAATGLTGVASGATIGGTGTIGGNLIVGDGGTLAPGQGVGTLTVNGALGLTGGSRLAYDFGQANVVGGALNDLTVVGGDLVLDGTIDVTLAPGGSIDPGVYRVISYAGALTDNGLKIGTMPAPGFLVQTSIANQVNLVNTAGLTLSYWDGAAGPKNDGVVNGGDGLWQAAAGNDNWTTASGTPNAPFADASFAIFMGAPGTVTVDPSLGAINVSGMQYAVDGYVVQGGPINLAGTNAIVRVGDGTAAGTGMTATINSVLAGAADLTKSDLGTLVLTAANSYSGGTTVTGGVLQIASDANLGAAAGGLTLDGGTLRNTADLSLARATTLGAAGGTFDTLGALTITSAITGAGGLTKTGAATLTLTGANAYAGPTTVSAGALYVEGNQAAATGTTSVASGATLGGSGTIGGSVAITDGATLSPGSVGVAPGTLAIAGGLSLAPGATLAYSFGQANVVGGALNDLTTVGGDLVLDGTINVTLAPGGSLDPGVYRVIDYAGALTDNGLVIGTIPAPGFLVQTSIANQVNLVNTAGLTLSYWDGAAGPKNDSVVNGGNGAWQASAGNDNWTTVTGTPNAPFSDGSFAIFMGAPGTVAVDSSLGAINAAGMQFAVDGYLVQGDPITLVGAAPVIRVGDGTAAGAGMTATINSVLAGTGGLTKSDLGTLILGAANSYSGGTSVTGGVLQVASDANLGDAAGGLTLDGGTLRNTATFTSARATTLDTLGGTFETLPGTMLTLSSPVTGAGALTKAGAGTLILTADAGYTGGTTIAAGTLQLGNGGTAGSVIGDIVDNGTLAINRSNALTLAGLISGTGALVQAGTGTTTLTGANSYAGTTTVSAGTLLVNGNQSAATGLTTVASGATIGGVGTIGGNVTIADGGILAPGTSPGTLTINGNLSLSGGSILNYEFGQANIPGGPLNDLTIVNGNLVLDGTINVTVSAGGSFDPGVYRVFNYAGTLTDNGLAVGTIPSTGYFVQTSVANQVNLVNTAGLTLNYWDGAAGPKNDGVVNGGNGTWQAAAGNDNWTTSIGVPNAPFTDASFAIFMGAPGNVTVDPSLGPINVSGMQYAVNGYVVGGGAINLVAPGSTIVRVGDGTAAGAGMTATINSVLAGTSGLTKSDLGTLILTGTNSYAGGTAVDGGVLQVASDANLGAAAGGLSFNGGTLRTTANITTARATVMNPAGGTLETVAGTTLAMTGTVSGPGALTKTGTGTLTLSGTNSYAGGTNVRAGVVEISRDANLGAAAGPLTLDTGTLRTTADITTARPITLAAGGGTFETTGTSALTVNSAIAGPGALAKTGSGALILRAVNSYTGPTNVAAGTLAVGDATSTTASINGPVSVASGATFGGYGTVNGGVTNAGTLAVADALDRFAAAGAGQFRISGALVNAGIADIGGAGVGNRLVVGSYLGQSGILALNTTLAGDGAPTDQLVINGGTATGGTTLRITNVGGQGAETPGNGIEIVVASAGATTAPTAFALTDRLVAGPYQYNLFRGGRDGSVPESWFLRSQQVDGVTPPPVEPGRPEPPLIRPEVPGYVVIPSLALLYGRALIGTLHERVGEQEQLIGRDDLPSRGLGGAWGRWLGQRIDWNVEGGVYGDGPAFRASNYAMQIGVDAVRSTDSSGGITFAGVYGAYGWTDALVRDYDMSQAGRAKLEAYTAGLYGTHYGRSGWYLDAVAQVTRYHARAGSGFFSDLKTKGTGVAASLEAGVPLHLGGGLTLEPQAQIMFQKIHFDDAADPAAEVHFDDVNSLTGRIGLRLAHNSERPGTYGPRPTTVWLRANVWREFIANPKTSFSSANGLVPFRSNMKDTWGELGAGVSTTLTRNANLFLTGAYQKSFDRDVKSWDVKAGLRFNW